MLYPVRALILLVAMVWLTGCSGGSDSSNPPQSSTPPESDTPQVTGQPGRFNGPVVAIVAARDGSGDIYVAGTFSTYNDRPVRPVVRLRPSGSLNETFVLATSIKPSSDPKDEITSIATADDGSGDLYLGEVFVDGVQVIGADIRVGKVWRVNPDGTVDPMFTRGELTWGGAVSDPLQLHTITPVGDGSGRFYVAGTFATYNGMPASKIVRVNRDGTLDTTFASAPPGTPGSVPGAEAFHVIPIGDNTGRIYVTAGIGSGFPPQLLFRVLPDGTRDPAFNAGSGLLEGAISAVVLVGDGSGDLFVGGPFDNQLFGTPSDPVRFLVRLNPDGSRDRSSPTPTVSSSPTFDASETVSLMARATDVSGDLFVVQGFSRLRRYKPTGLLDPQFQVGQTNGSATVLLPTTDNTGDVYLAGGDFSSYNGVPVGNIVRIHRDGSLAN